MADKIKALAHIGKHNYKQLIKDQDESVNGRRNCGEQDRQVVGPPDEFVVRIDNLSTQAAANFVSIDRDATDIKRSVSMGTGGCWPGKAVNGGSQLSFRTERNREFASSPHTRNWNDRGKFRRGEDPKLNKEGAETIWLESSYDLHSDLPSHEYRYSPGSGNCDNRRSKSFDLSLPPDPSSRLIGAFLQRQRAIGGISLDLDLDMDELRSGEASNLSQSWRRSETEDGLGERDLSIRGSLRQGCSYDNLVQLNSVLSEAPGSTDLDSESRPGTVKVDRALDKELYKEAVPDTFVRSPENKREMAPAVVLCVLEKPSSILNDVGNSEKTLVSRNAISGGLSREQEVGATGNSATGIRSRKGNASRQQSFNTQSGEQDVAKAFSFVGEKNFTRLKSRLADAPPPQLLLRTSQSGKAKNVKSGQTKSDTQRSGLLGRIDRVDEEEEDPFKDADFPEHFRIFDCGFWMILQWITFFVILGAIICFTTVPLLKRHTLWGLLLWKWALLVMVVFSGRLVSGWIVWLLVRIVEMNFLLRKRVLYFVYALRKGVQNCLWLALALLAWHLIFDPKVDRTTKALTYVTKVLECCLIAAVVFLLKIFLVKIFASTFHVSTYFERIQEALFNQFVLETLSGPPVLEVQESLEEEERLYDELAGLKEAGAIGPELPPRSQLLPNNGMVGRKEQSQFLTKSGMIGRAQGDRKATDKKSAKIQAEGISVESLHKLNQQNISAWNMKRLVNLIRHSTLTQTIEETYDSGMDTEVNSEWQAKRAAKQIFRNVASRETKFIKGDDLLRFMRVDEAKRALALFDGGVETGNITKHALKNWVINVFRERRALALSLNDTKTAVNKLHRIINVVVGLIIIVVSMLVLGIATTHLLLFISSQLLLVVFVFGNTCKTVFEAIVFLFVMHPFDVGDRCIIDGNQMVVEEMNILTTVFLGDFNVKVWYPNSVLAIKPISNFYRSPDMGDSYDFYIHSATPVEKISQLKEKVGKYVLSKPQHWQPTYNILVLDLVEVNKLKLSLGLQHTMNHQDMGERMQRKSDLILALKSYFEELGIEHHLPPQNVNIRTLH